jgi:hypothetical protein
MPQARAMRQAESTAGWEVVWSTVRQHGRVLGRAPCPQDRGDGQRGRSPGRDVASQGQQGDAHDTADGAENDQCVREG